MKEHINMTKAAGVALGFLGVLLIARPWSSSGAINIIHLDTESAAGSDETMTRQPKNPELLERSTQ